MTPTTETADVDERIRDAALATLRERGYACLSMEGVAAEAGVAKTTVYRRYRNRADLATAALAHQVVVEPDHAHSGDTKAAMKSFLLLFGTRFEEMGLDVLGSMLVEGEDPELMELHRERVIHPRIEIALAIMRRGQEAGQIREDADLRLALEMMVGSFFSRHIAGRELAPEEWASQVTEAVWVGLEPR